MRKSGGDPQAQVEQQQAPFPTFPLGPRRLPKCMPHPHSRVHTPSTSTLPTARRNKNSCGESIISLKPPPPPPLSSPMACAPIARLRSALDVLRPVGQTPATPPVGRVFHNVIRSLGGALLRQPPTAAAAA